MRTSIATVCLSGALDRKLHAAADAGFDGVEIFEPDLVVSQHSPEEIAALADRLGLALDLYQPFRDAEGVDDASFGDVVRRARAKFALMNRMGIDTMLVCSNVATATRDSDDVSARQLAALGDVAGEHGIRLAYEALAWGRFVDDYRHAWRIVERADHPQVGVCLDSFHILSRGHDPAGIEQIPGDKIFFLQLADAPVLTMDVLSWSRHHRLFPGEGGFDLPAFLGHVLRAGYEGPISLEVFNDTFRQTDPERTALQARRSLRWLEDHAAAAGVGAGMEPLPDVQHPTAFGFVEVKGEDTSPVEALLGQLGFTFRGRHRTKPVRLWSAGDAYVVCNEQHARDSAPSLAALGFDVTDPRAGERRAEALAAPTRFRQAYAGEQELPTFAAPDGTEIMLSAATGSGREPGWVDEFEGGSPPPGSTILGVDHVNLVQPWQHYDEAALFYESVLALHAQPAQEVAGPAGLVLSRVMRTADGAVRLALNLLPAGLAAGAGLPQHVAFATSDVRAAVEHGRRHGLRVLDVPDNYYEDLTARFDLDPDFVTSLRSLDLLYDRDADGEFLHCYTRTIGDVFFELVERRQAYDGFGAPNAPVRLAAQTVVA
ncbi:4-hydroxyphenylpyruvate dioxygenase [Mumia flava]|uniref:3-dehydroshikimate dehydratase n=1 Tax=Mumia flava TaxID=1348852 RepID=A0A0B2BVS7_9ACTN|nr:sugar phosphate isomerase/epimerase and 4-hydroxyphenylpyruvate domain-containing protein [Mumia flava]PJJ58047.1 4-hydroxyphenylpyruvate dioxygenase [Mumia flava]